MFQIREQCGHCRQAADFLFVHVNQYVPREVLLRKSDQPMDTPAQNADDLLEIEEEEIDDLDTHAYGTAICPQCGHPSLFMFEADHVRLSNIMRAVEKVDQFPGRHDTMKIIKVLPEPSRPSIDLHWPEEVHELFRDAQHLVAENRSPSIVIATCRSVLEVSVKRLDSQGHDLNTRINDLRTKGIITQGITDWAHAARLAGNQAVHEIAGSAADAKELVEFVRQFLDVAFTLPATIKARKQKKVTA